MNVSRNDCTGNPPTYHRLTYPNNTHAFTHSHTHTHTRAHTHTHLSKQHCQRTGVPSPTYKQLVHVSLTRVFPDSRVVYNRPAANVCVCVCV